MTYEEAIAFLEGTPRYSHKEGLKNTEELLAYFFPEGLPFPYVHVAGTNGKGSTCALLAQSLTESGLRVGRYISPHLVDYAERMAIDGENISHDEFAEFVSRVQARGEEMRNAGGNFPTFFEILTMSSMLYFAAHQVDIAVIEVGLGGRLDATNALGKPLASVICSISLDHQKVLGGTVEEIAAEKAGIIKPGVPVVLGRNLESVQKVIHARAKKLGAPYCYAGNTAVRVLKNDMDGLVFSASGMENIKTPLFGDYQVDNCVLALRVLRLLQRLGLPLETGHIRRGFRNVAWPGRMERARYGDAALIIDGAHNSDAARKLVHFLGRSGEKYTLLFTMLGRKDVEAVIGIFAAADIWNRAVFCSLREESHSLPFTEAERIWYNAATKKTVRLENGGPVRDALELVKTEPRVMIAGSLYLVGEVKEVLC